MFDLVEYIDGTPYVPIDTALDVIDRLNRRIEELERQLESIGAGGVNGERLIRESPNKKS